MSRIFNFLFAFLLFFAVVPAGFSQSSTGTILGVVKDSSGAVVPGATLTITATDTGTTRTAISGDDGAYRVPELLVGHYSVKVEKEGFKTQTLTGLTLEVTQELVVNAALQVGSSTQEVTVTGEVPVVNTTNASLGGTVNQDRMTDLPLNGRNWADLSLLQPGTEQHRNTGGSSPVTTSGDYFSSSGAPLRSNMYTLDGAIMTSLYGNAANSVNSSTLGVDGFQEFKLTTNNFSAEYGLSMGSQVTIVSRAGTNQWHGAAFEYLRNSDLDARNFFDTPQSSGINAAGGVNRLPPFKRNNFGASVGGPIQKDRTFFFATFEGLRERKGLTNVSTTIPLTAVFPATAPAGLAGTTGSCRVQYPNPCATLNPATSVVASSVPQYSVNPLIMPFLRLTPPSGQPLFPAPTPGLPANEFSYPFTRPVDEYFGQYRLDHTFSSKDSGFARYTIDYADLSQPTIASQNPSTFDHVHGSSELMTASETHIFSPTLLNNARFSLSIQEPQDQSVTPNYVTGLGGTCTGGLTACDFIPGWPALGIGGISIGGSATFSSSVQVSGHQKIFIYSDDLFKTVGRHALKIGVLITHWNDGVRYFNGTRGSISYGNLADFLNGDDYSSISAITPFNAANTEGVIRNYTYGTLGAYIQDDIRLTPRLTINAGLRYEILLPNISEQNGLQAALRDPATDQYTTPGPVMENPGFKNFSPRVGFAWDVQGNGKTSVRGGAAMMYDVGNLFPDIIEGVAHGGLIGMTQLGAVGTTITPTTISQASSCPASPLTIPLVFPSCFVGASTFTSNDYITKQPTIVTYSLVIERQLPWGIGLSAGYSGSVGWHLWNRPDDNPCVPSAVVSGVPNWVPVGGAVASGNNPICPNGRVNPYWGYMDMATTMAREWYNALQILSQKRLSNGLQFQANYTWARSIDTGSSNLPGDETWSAYPSELVGPSAFDIQQNFALSMLYNLPKVSAGGFEGAALNGWRLGLILTAQTGPPFTPTLSKDRSLSGIKGSDYTTANLVPGRSIASITSGVSTTNGIDPCPTAGQPLGTPNLWYDPCAFTIGPVGYLGNAGRNILYGPGLVEPDFSVTKDTAVKFLGESGALEFRAEIFNIINRANFGMPGNGGVYPVYGGSLATTDVEAPLASAGVVIRTNTTSRQVQFALRLVF